MKTATNEHGVFRRHRCQSVIIPLNHASSSKTRPEIGSVRRVNELLPTELLDKVLFCVTPAKLRDEDFSNSIVPH